MQEVNFIIEALSQSPTLLQSLIAEIPAKNFHKKRVPNKWSLTEQCDHLLKAQEILFNRFLQFENELEPYIASYNPPNKPEANQISLDMGAIIKNFKQSRKTLVAKLRQFDSTYWSKTGKHELYEPYNSRLLLRHTLHVDYVHFFSIEQLGLTRQGLENDILTLP